MQEDLLNFAINRIEKSDKAFLKFLSANDTGSTKSHQSGIYIPKNAYSILFDHEGNKGENLDKNVNIKWMNDKSTSSRFIYYGKKTRDEYRITKFGRNFPYLKPEYTGALFILTQDDIFNYSGFVFNSEDEINYIMEYFGISPTETNQLLSKKPFDINQMLNKIVFDYLESNNQSFPSTEEMADLAYRIFEHVFNHSELILTNPDGKLLNWVDMEYKMFSVFEEAIYNEQIHSGFKNMNSFLKTANTIMNRRKSRAGKSLENHLKTIFEENKLNFTFQGVTEQNKKPDFTFPSIDAYHNQEFDSNKLILLEAKTTCKDRWRQILNTGDRRKDKTKYLFTLQPAISENQLKEMTAENVQLIIPETNIQNYPKEFRDKIWTLKDFIDYVKTLNSNSDMKD